LIKKYLKILYSKIESISGKKGRGVTIKDAQQNAFDAIKASFLQRCLSVARGNI
jgi:hypothetical protein